MTYSGDKNKTRTNITINKDLKAKAEDIAQRENRSFNSLVIYALEKYIKHYKG